MSLLEKLYAFLFFFSMRRRHTRLQGDWSSDVCSSDCCAARLDAHGASELCFRLVVAAELKECSPEIVACRDVARIEAEGLAVATHRLGGLATGQAGLAPCREGLQAVRLIVRWRRWPRLAGRDASRPPSEPQQQRLREVVNELAGNPLLAQAPFV